MAFLSLVSYYSPIPYPKPMRTALAILVISTAIFTYLYFATNPNYHAQKQNR